ncbi:MAG: hypothetical protein HZB15_16895 [Actinobacteria bacterium]|nr:hypothetical protein [Actinomycetota bacterium]
MPDERELEDIADQTSQEVQPDDPYVEPPNSTVDDWFGQRVQRDADRLSGETTDVPSKDEGDAERA